MGEYNTIAASVYRDAECYFVQPKPCIEKYTISPMMSKQGVIECTNSKGENVCCDDIAASGNMRYNMRHSWEK